MQGFPGSSAGESTYNAGDPGSIPGSRRCPGEGIGYLLQYSWAPLVVQTVKNLPAMREIWVQSLGWDDSIHRLQRCPGGGHGNPLQHSCLKNPRGQRSLAGYNIWGCKESDTTEPLTAQHSAEGKSLSQGTKAWLWWRYTCGSDSPNWRPWSIVLEDANR